MQQASNRIYHVDRRGLRWFIRRYRVSHTLHNFSHWHDEDSGYTGQLLLIFLTVGTSTWLFISSWHVHILNMFLIKICSWLEMFCALTCLLLMIINYSPLLRQCKKASLKWLIKRGFTKKASLVCICGCMDFQTPLILLGQQSLVVNTLPSHIALYDSHTKYGVK